MIIDQAILEEAHKSLSMTFKLLEEVESTNDEAFKLLEESDFCAVLAKKQNAGRGRLGRKWEGETGDCIFYSAGFKLPKNFNISLLTCLIALEILNLIDTEKTEKVANPEYIKKAENAENAEATLKLSIKWPNDIYYEGRKLCGILTESKAKNGRIESIVIGVGINVNMPKNFEGFKREPSCLSEFSNISFCDMAIILSKAVKNTYAKLSIEYLDFAKDFTKRDFLINKEISIDRAGEVLTGIAQGVDDGAKLKILDTKENKIHLLNAGEVSIL